MNNDIAACVGCIAITFKASRYLAGPILVGCGDGGEAVATVVRQWRNGVIARVSVSGQSNQVSASGCRQGNVDGKSQEKNDDAEMTKGKA